MRVKVVEFKGIAGTVIRLEQAERIDAANKVEKFVKMVVNGAVYGTLEFTLDEWADFIAGGMLFVTDELK